MWWDQDAGRYRTSLPYKVFYVWTWPLSRWLMFHCMSSERAHQFGICVAIPLVARIDRAYEWLKLGLVLPPLIVIALLCKLFPRWFWIDDGGQR